MRATDDEGRAIVSEYLWQLVISEARLHSERSSYFLVANAFLFTGFAVLRQASSHGMQFVPLSVGMTLSVLHFININYGEKVRRLWEEMLKSQTNSGEPLRQRDALFERTWWLHEPIGLLTRNIGSWAFPAVFLIMWICLAALEAISS